MAIVDVQSLIEAGVHFGHRTSRWNPKMEPHIMGKRNGIHIIDLRRTIRGIVRARNFLTKLIADGGTILVVGTKRQAQSLVGQIAEEHGQHYVSERWLGGMLTNHKTIRQRLHRLEEIERMEEDGSLDLRTKKEISRIRREKSKILRNLSGVRNMHELPDALVVIDPHREHIAVSEAWKLGIPTVSLIDTDCDPDTIDILIPGNDDAFRSIQTVLELLEEAIARGVKEHRAQVEAKRKAAEKRAAAERAERERKKAEAAERAKRAAEEKAKALAAEAARAAAEAAKQAGGDEEDEGDGDGEAADEEAGSTEPDDTEDTEETSEEPVSEKAGD